MARGLVLIASASRTELENLAGSLEKEGYQSIGATSIEELDAALRQSDKIVLALIDITDFDEGLWTRCDLLRQSRVPYVIITPNRAAGIPDLCIRHAAGGAMVKPIDGRSLAAVVQALLV